MTLAQLLGLRCCHRRKSIPICRRQHCLGCGEVFEFSSYDLSEIDHTKIDHYITTDRAVKRIQRLLHWRRKA